MPKMISIARLDTAKLTDKQTGIERHNAKFGQYATMLDMLGDPNDPAQFAVVFDVHDLEGLRAATRTPEASAYMASAGFIEQLAVYHSV